MTVLVTSKGYQLEIYRQQLLQGNRGVHYPLPPASPAHRPQTPGHPLEMTSHHDDKLYCDSSEI